MSTLTAGCLTLPVAAVGEDNPLPPLDLVADTHGNVDATGADPEMARNLQYGQLTSLLPYTIQDGYDRNRSLEQVPTLALQNDLLRATFLPTWGGRLWSLMHLPTGRELLYCNPVLQPTNFALRGAWFSGGVEWNIGATGHSPLTCSPVHAARVTTDDGTPVLRLYEWERAREATFQVDAWLPDGSPTLLVYVRIVNPNDHEIPMYWWSNIAVPETSDVRVLAPAREAYHFSYDQRLRVVPVPGSDDPDPTYPSQNQQSADYFFECRRARQPWIAAVDRRGQGLVQTSTADLVGRKLFVWGRSPGGRHWQEFLSGQNSDQEYCEIQAGLARTQLEHLAMPAQTQWSWVEAYGLLDAEPSAVHGPWSAALDAVGSAVSGLAPASYLEECLRAASDRADRPPDDDLSAGTGWGALERRLRRTTGQPPLDLPGLPFPDETLAERQAPWLTLLQTGGLPDADPLTRPTSYATGQGWLDLLNEAPEGWATCLHRGIAHWANEDATAARDAWQRSLEIAVNPWALRNLAVADYREGDLVRSAERYRRAYDLVPDEQALLIETLTSLVRAERPGDALDVAEGQGSQHRRHGRVQLLEACAALQAGDLERAGRMLDEGIVVPDLREGESALHGLWMDHRAAVGSTEPVPYAYDFRMHL